MSTTRRPYARVSDGLSSHAKVTRIPRGVRAEALGTWVLCLSWCNEHLTDGYMPGHLPEELGGTAAGVEALVAAGLWRRSRAGGYTFVNWSEHQSTREQVEHARAKNRERQDRYRGKTPEQPVLPGLDDDSVTRDSGASNPPTSSSSSTSSATATTTTTTTTKTGLIEEPPAPSVSARATSSLHTGESPGDKSGELDVERLRQRLLQLAPGIDPAFPADVSDERVAIAARFVLDKKPGSPPVNPTAYVLASFTKDPAGWERFAYEGRLPS